MGILREDFNERVIPLLLELHDLRLTSSVNSFRKALRTLDSNQSSPNGLVSSLSQASGNFLSCYRELVDDKNLEKTRCLGELYKIIVEGLYYPAWNLYNTPHVVSVSGEPTYQRQSIPV